jgi:hypothetical protein
VRRGGAGIIYGPLVYGYLGGRNRRGFRLVRKRLILHAPLKQQNAAHHDQDCHHHEKHREERAPLVHRPASVTACHSLGCHSFSPKTIS